MKKVDDPMLLNLLMQDAEKVDSKFLAGDYWRHKTIHSLGEIKKYGLEDFRGTSNLISQSYGDNIHYNVLNELNLINPKEYKEESANTLLKRQLNFTEIYFNQTLELFERILKNDEATLALIKKYNVEDSTEFGCVYKIKIKGREYSLQYLNLLQQIDFALNKINSDIVSTIFEIGGGFGATAHLILRNFPKVRKYLYMDIVPNLYVGTQYLKSFFQDSVVDYLSTNELEEIKFKDNDDLEVICIAPWQLSKVKSKIDLFYNSHSFVEIPKETLEYYKLQILKMFRNEKTKIILISYDGFNPKTTPHPDILLQLFNETKMKKYSHATILDEKRENFFYISV